MMLWQVDELGHFTLKIQQFTFTIFSRFVSAFSIPNTSISTTLRRFKTCLIGKYMTLYNFISDQGIQSKEVLQGVHDQDLSTHTVPLKSCQLDRARE